MIDLRQGDCLEVMKELEDGSMDLILCDLPYGITNQNKWDSVIPFELLWISYRRLIKENGVIVLTAQNKFTILLASSALDLYRYNIVWEKTKAGGFLNAKRMPLQAHEDVLVFYKKLPTYNPQMEVGKPYTKKAVTDGDGANYGSFSRVGTTAINAGTRYPRSVVKIANDHHGSLHPTQKPLALLEYLVKTYSNEGDLVLDNCMGSGTTGVACKNLNRSFIGIELDSTYFNLASERIANS